jgi:hypothetical protein
MADKIFADGLIYKAPRENAPEFVKGSLSFKVDEFIKFLEANNTNGGWVNVDIKLSQGGKLYCELNTYKPEKTDSLKEGGLYPGPEGDQAQDAVFGNVGEDEGADAIPF